MARVPAGESVADSVPSVHAGIYGAFARHLATRPAHTRNAYLRHVVLLLLLAEEGPPRWISRAQLSRFLATLHGRGLSGRSLARMLSAWRAFFRYLLETSRAMRGDPSTGLKC